MLFRSQELMERWEALGLELHYLPPIDMSKEGGLKKWVRPDFKNIDPSQLSPDAMLLPGCWVLVDGRKKPEYDESGNQNYGNDGNFLGPVLEKLRKKGLVEKSERPMSRFSVSPEELEKPVVAAAIAEAMGLGPGQVSLPRMVEFNVLGNLHHPEWGGPLRTAGNGFPTNTKPAVGGWAVASRSLAVLPTSAGTTLTVGATTWVSGPSVGSSLTSRFNDP